MYDQTEEGTPVGSIKIDTSKGEKKLFTGANSTNFQSIIIYSYKLFALMPSFVLQLAALKYVCKVLNVKTQPADIQSYEKFPLYRRACPDSSGGLGGGRKKKTPAVPESSFVLRSLRWHYPDQVVGV